jgi:hypothetical protein
MSKLINVKDIVTGDHIIQLCDVIITDAKKTTFHKNILNFGIEILFYENFDIKYLLGKKFPIKIFVYSDQLDRFIKDILPLIENKIQCVLYIHNSDASFEMKHLKICDSNSIISVYSQNIDCDFHKKLNILPIGIANSMWNHGDLEILSKTMNKNVIKNKSIYINLNYNTYSYRKIVLNSIHNIKKVTTLLPYNQYLEQLAEHRFCLCVRGNGLDTHRFWESLYLKVIPIVINNHITQLNKFLLYLRQLNVPFIEIKDANEINEERFSQALYEDIKIDTSALKICHYIN